MTEPRGTQADRRLRNLLIEPTKQFRVTMFTLLVGLSCLLGFCAFQIWVYSHLVWALAPTSIDPNDPMAEMIRSSINLSWIGLGVGALCFGGIVTTLTLAITHRIYGPMVAIRRHLKALLKGDTSVRTTLRKNDEFKDLAEDLNRLSEKLGGSAPSA